MCLSQRVSGRECMTDRTRSPSCLRRYACGFPHAWPSDRQTNAVPANFLGRVPPSVSPERVAVSALRAKRVADAADFRFSGAARRLSQRTTPSSTARPIVSTSEQFGSGADETTKHRAVRAHRNWKSSTHELRQPAPAAATGLRPCDPVVSGKSPPEVTRRRRASSRRLHSAA